MKHVQIAFVLVLSSVLSTNAQANTVEQIYHDRQEVALRIQDKSIQIGQELVIEFGNGLQCTAQIQKIDRGMALASLQDCPNKHQIKRGDRALKPVFAEASDEAKKKLNNDNASENRKESWYTYWGLGLGLYSFSDDVTNNQESLLSEKDTTFTADVLGFYFPSESLPGWLRGGVLNYSFFNGTRREIGAATASLLSNHSFLAFSNYYFYRQEIGSGFFLRGDVGLLIQDVELFNTNVPDRATKENILGYLIGVGGSFPMTSETRVLFQLTHRRSLGGVYSIPVTGLSAGVLF